MNSTETLEEIKRNLQQFHGTVGYYPLSKNQFPYFVLSDGCRYLAKSCECFWLFDAIAHYQLDPRIRTHPKLQEIQFWTLEIKDSRAFLRCDWDAEQTVFDQEIPYTDFPLDSVRVWVAPQVLNNRKYHVAYLPSEH